MSAAVCEPLLQVAELKTKLDAAESFPGTLGKELPQSQRESDRQRREEVGGARGATSPPPGARGSGWGRGHLPPDGWTPTVYSNQPSAERWPMGKAVRVTQVPRAKNRGHFSRIRRREVPGSLPSLPRKQADLRLPGSSRGENWAGASGYLSRTSPPGRKFILRFCFYSYRSFLLPVLIIRQFLVFVQLLFSLQRALQISVTFVILKI